MIKALAEEHQIGDELHPLSLITMYTAEKQDVTDEDLYLRGRAVQLGNTEEADIDCVNAIVNIMRTLKTEGICDMKFNYGDGQGIGAQLRGFLDQEECQRRHGIHGKVQQLLSDRPLSSEWSQIGERIRRGM